MELFNIESAREQLFTWLNLCRTTGTHTIWFGDDIEGGKRHSFEQQYQFEDFIARLTIAGADYDRLINIPKQYLDELQAKEAVLMIFKIRKNHLFIENLVVPTTIAEIFDYQIQKNEFVLVKIIFR